MKECEHASQRNTMNCALAVSQKPVDRVFLVASAPWHDVASAAELVRQQLRPEAEIIFVLSPRQPLLEEFLRDRNETLKRLPFSMRASIGASIELRSLDHSLTVALFTGERGYRRLKIAAFLIGMPRLLIVNESQDYFTLSFQPLLRHVHWRMREFLVRKVDTLRTIWRTFRREGWSGVWTDLGKRHPLTGRVLHRFKTRLSLFRRRRFSVPYHLKPEVSVVIPAHNQWNFTYRCLRSIAHWSADDSLEVILVDNGSADASQDAEKIVTGLRIVRLSENRGFVGACNAGAAAAMGKYVLFLNNDIEVTPGWLQALVEVFHAHPDCGAVGAKLVFPNGLLQEAGGIIWQSGNAWNYGKYDDPERPEYCYLRRVDYCSGAALMVRRDDLDEVGGFDDLFYPGYWEDADLCFTLRSRGRTVWFQPKSKLYHYEGASSGIDTSSGMKRFQPINRDKFIDKWSAQLAQQQPFSVDRLFLARDRNRGPIILVIDHYVPTHDRDAGSAFMDCFLRTLADKGFRVLFWPDNLVRTPCYSERLQYSGIEVLYGRLDLQEYLKTYGVYVDAAIAYRAPIAMKYLPHLRRALPSLGYIAVDLEHVRERRRGEVEVREPAEIETLKQRERKIVSLVDTVGVHNVEEGRIIRDELGARHVVHLPLPVSDRKVRSSTAFENRHGLVFVGSTHPPNVDGVRFFVREVLPQVRRQLGATDLHIIGDVCETIRDLAKVPGVHLLGYVDDLARCLDRYRVFVAPLRYGAGIKGKIIEAMNIGIPVVTTEIGAEGIGIEPGVEALVATGPEAFAQSVVDVYCDEEHWSRLRNQGWELVRQCYAQDSFRQAVDRFMSCLTATHAGS